MGRLPGPQSQACPAAHFRVIWRRLNGLSCLRFSRGCILPAMDAKHTDTPGSRRFDDLYSRPNARDGGHYEDKTTLAHRLRKAAAGILAAIAVEQGATYVPPPVTPPGIVQSMNNQAAPAAAAVQAAKFHLPGSYRVGSPNPFGMPAGLPGATAFKPTVRYARDEGIALWGESHPFGGVAFADGSVLQTSNDPVERVVSSVSAAQSSPVPSPEASAVKETLQETYKDVVAELHDHEKVAQVIADAMVSKAVEAAIDRLPELAGSVLIALGVKKRKNKETTPSLDQTADDLEKINELYAEGVPLTTANIQRLSGFSLARIRAAMQAGLYVEEWHPAGLSYIETKLETEPQDTAREQDPSQGHPDEGAS